jgi:hypothetical protein
MATKRKKTVAEEVDTEDTHSENNEKPPEVGAVVGQAAELKKDVDIWPAGTEGYFADIGEDEDGNPTYGSFIIRQNANSRVVVDYDDVRGKPNGYGGY